MLLDEISRELNIPVSFLREIKEKASYNYRRFELPKSNGRKRIIYHPAKELKLLQRWLVDKYISKFPVHDSVYSYRIGRNIGHNAMIYARNNYLLRIDLKNFFPSITGHDVRELLRQQSALQHWTADDIDLFVSIVCKNNALTIGAPSSPSISNAICLELDEKLSTLAKKNTSAYSRYADDLFFSCSSRNTLKNFEPSVSDILKSLTFPKNLSINQSKTKHLSKKQRRIVTGITLTSQGGISLGRNTKRRIKALIHQYDTIPTEDKKYLAGILAHAQAIEPAFINRLYIKYGSSQVERSFGRLLEKEKVIQMSHPAEDITMVSKNPIESQSQ